MNFSQDDVVAILKNSTANMYIYARGLLSTRIRRSVVYGLQLMDLCEVCAGGHSLLCGGSTIDLFKKRK
jgi:hypothetical protein